MKVSEKLKALIYYSVNEHNLIVLTSRCNVQCFFCSHKQNPKGVEAFFVPHLPLEEIKEQMVFLSPEKKIIIGESATRICEGEPFTHPDIKKVLTIIRNKMTTTPIQITTNGTLLDKVTGTFLKELGFLELNLSLNSISPFYRKKIMKDENSDRIKLALQTLDKLNIPFHGSIVALPHVTGWQELAESIKFLKNNGALSIRIFLPGYTRLAPPDLSFDNNLVAELSEFVAAQGENDIPVTLEPPLLNNLTPVVEGVLKDSLAVEAGIKRGDLILQVKGKTPFSRVDAFHMIKKSSNPLIKIRRNNKDFTIRINKKMGDSSGIVVNYDISPYTLNSIIKQANSFNPEKVLLLTSEFAYLLLKVALNKRELQFNLKKVKNTFFGGSIGCSGLLTVRDFKVVAEEEIKEKEIELIILPKEAFDTFGKDLTGQSFLELEEELKVPVITL